MKPWHYAVAVGFIIYAACYLTTWEIDPAKWTIYQIFLAVIIAGFSIVTLRD